MMRRVSSSWYLLRRVWDFSELFGFRSHDRDSCRQACPILDSATILGTVQPGPSALTAMNGAASHPIVTPPRLQVDWSRFHLQVLFVDTEDMGNARVAQGLFDSIAEWNGHGRTLYSWTCGTAVTGYEPERAVSLMMRAESLGAPVKTFSRAPEQLELKDLYTYDVIIAMNEDVKAATLALFEPDLAADWDSEESRNFYKQRVCVLSDFLRYASNEQLAKRGASSLMPRNMAQLVTPDVARLRALSDIPQAQLSRVDEWNYMVKCILLGNAGLMQYLLDSYPDDLDYFWLE